MESHLTAVLEVRSGKCTGDERPGVLDGRPEGGIRQLHLVQYRHSLA